MGKDTRKNVPLSLVIVVNNLVACFLFGDRGGTVVKVLRYKSEGRWFDSRWCHWNFPLTLPFRSHYGPEFDSASNINENQEHFLEVKGAGA
jgi:hypothetical protein